VADAADPSTPDERFASDAAAERLDRLRAASHYLDDAFRVPGTDYRIGLDPLLGLLPVVGDTPGAVVSAYIVAEAAAMGVPRETLARMLFNVVVDAVFGSLPFVGDAFDAVWKANVRNVRLLEARADAPDGTADRRFLVVVTALVFALAVGLVALATAAGWWALQRVGAL
jgi:hypothetical protein